MRGFTAYVFVLGRPADWRAWLVHCLPCVCSMLNWSFFARVMRLCFQSISHVQFDPYNGTWCPRRKSHRQRQQPHAGYLANYEENKKTTMDLITIFINILALAMNDWTEALSYSSARILSIFVLTWKITFARWRISTDSGKRVLMGTWSQLCVFSIIIIVIIIYSYSAWRAWLTGSRLASVKLKCAINILPSKLILCTSFQRKCCDRLPATKVLMPAWLMPT